MKTLNKQEIREYVLSQIGDTTALGSKTFPKRVQKKIIRLCTPIFREHYRVIERYANMVTYVIDVNMPFDEDYVNDRGEFTAVEWYGGNAQELVFRYEDYQMGNHYDVDVNMPISWLDDDSLEKYEKQVQSNIVNEINKQINKKQDEILKLRKVRETFRRGSH